ncbi:E3 ubiquitinprotein ligase MARCH5like [Caligus rogercresseyi]|uniref:E3 ubiquitin-protein ligase MARCHF5 n=2 Tax=Caligus rogercresseyi TaxID=217165 RepID=A0A7T8GR42_CALRO|nr:E3 ubiquitinprotein ligase MARCH5like [Caligus rogercresseyi]
MTHPGSDLSPSVSSSPVSVSSFSVDEDRQCWICYAYEEDEPSATWVNPCRCSGTTKWGHQLCIQRWIDEKQKYAKMSPVECPQCGTPYVLRFPPVPLAVRLLDSTDQFVERLCPILTGGICFASAYWSCVTYGAITVMQIYGHRKGMYLMESVDPLVLLVTLPLVPLGLCMGKMVRWHEPIISFLRIVVPKTPLVRTILPSFAEPSSQDALAASSSSSTPVASDPISITRVIVGALFLPAVSSLLGSTIFRSADLSHLQKTLCGGITYVTLKGALKIYHRQYLFLQHKKESYSHSTKKNLPPTQNPSNNNRRRDSWEQ